MKAHCPLCGSTDVWSLFQHPGIPRYNLVLYRTRAEALNAARGVLDFKFCPQCLFTFNAAFDPALMDYRQQYNSNRSHSPTFLRYLDEVCERLDAIFQLQDKVVVEIGCGEGAFLEYLRQKVRFRGMGYDPNVSYEGPSREVPDVAFVADYYDPKRIEANADVFLFRHILEHQSSLTSFLNPLIGPLSQERKIDLYIEVPCWEWICQQSSLNAFSYEHCSYYTGVALKREMERMGYLTRDLLYTFGQEYLQYFGTSRPLNHPVGLAPRVSEIESIRQTQQFQSVIPSLRLRLQELFNTLTGCAVLWGAGGKGTTLLNILGIGYQQLGSVVDNNPTREHTFIPGTGQEVILPEALVNLQPDTVLLTNSGYRNEISKQLLGLGLKPRLFCLDEWMCSQDEARSTIVL